MNIDVPSLICTQCGKPMVVTGLQYEGMCCGGTGVASITPTQPLQPPKPTPMALPAPPAPTPPWQTIAVPVGRTTQPIPAGQSGIIATGVEVNNLQVLNSMWFNTMKGCCGIVLAKDVVSGEQRLYAGTASGADQEADERDIISWGQKVNVNILREMMDKVTPLHETSEEEKGGTLGDIIQRCES